MYFPSEVLIILNVLEFPTCLHSLKLKLGKFKTTVLRTDGSKLNNPYFLQRLETCAK